ncbi:MAG: ATP-binding protein [Oscillospiraceae bacterium]|nr:ATP-binding protein [Oscillospiraceae bacterium]MBQ9208693.1 ATP-binding protein [Oscillospiraceae bacterium]
MYSIKRHIAPIIERRAKNSKALLLTGSRQVGKSTLFRHLFGDLNRVTFDDDLLLAQAADDIGLFLLNNPAPLVIDEVQKCPSIFNKLKMILDNTEEHGNFLLTGSQKLQLMEGISESLAGRISVVELDGLSLREIYDVDFNRHFVPSDEYISEREKVVKKYGSDIWSIIHRGSYPELYSNPGREWIDYYQSYVKTYLERDVNQLVKAKNHLTFVKFMTSAAARTGQIVNYANIADQVGVSQITIKEWLSILEKSGIIYILKPYTSSVLNRAIKTPKLYFRDTGLCSYLTRWLTPDTLKNGAMAGAMFETFVINEILKSFTNEGLDYDFDVFFYNGKDKKRSKADGISEEISGEIDLIIQEGEILHPVEIKMSTMPKANMAAEFDVLDGIPDKKRGMGAIICLADRKLYLRENLVALPLEYI